MGIKEEKLEPRVKSWTKDVTSVGTTVDGNPAQRGMLAPNVSGLTVIVRSKDEGKGNTSGELVPSRKCSLVFWGGPGFWCSEVLTCFCGSLPDTVSALDPPLSFASQSEFLWMFLERIL